MPHNPIIKRSPLGTSPPDIGATQRGVLFDGRDYWDLPARMGMQERLKWRNHVLTVVECGWRAWKMPSFSLTTADRQPVEWECEITYRVADAKKLVQKRVNDVEVELKRALLSSLAGVATRYRLSQHSETPAQLAQAVRDATIFPELGLEVDPGVRMTPRLSVGQLKFIGDARQLDQASRRPVSRSRKHELQTSQPHYRRAATVRLDVQIVDRGLFDSLDDLDQAVDAIWEGKVLGVLERVSSKYAYHQLADANDALAEAVETAVDARRFDGYGLRVENVAVRLELDPKAAAAAKEDEDLRRKLETESKLDAHYRSLALKDRVGAVALALARGEMTMIQAMDYFDERQLQNLRLSMESFEKFQKLDVMAPDTTDAAVSIILGRSLSETTNRDMASGKEEINLREMIQLMGGSGDQPAKALTDSAGGK